MKLSQSFLKLTIRFIILLILLIGLYMISAFLYSARYWPDVYNYINANITIERIPTISELNIQIVEVGYDYTTEVQQEEYSTTDVDYFELSTTDDFDIDEFMTARFDAKTRAKRNIMLEEVKDYRELPNRPIFVDYVFLEEPIEIDKIGNNTDEERDILRTSITKNVIDHQVNSQANVNINDNTTSTTEFIVNREHLIKDDRKNNIEHATTREGYLVGDQMYHKMKGQSTIELLELTTDTNEIDLDEAGSRNLLKDLVDMSKLSTRGPEDVEMIAEVSDAEFQELAFTNTVFPWVATIFIKNSTENSQFHYYCDGALLSEKVILTGGRCVYLTNSIVAPENVLVFLGKTNLQTVGGSEKLHRVKTIVLHHNFTVDFVGRAVNDLALLIMDAAAEFNDRIQSACIQTDETSELQDAATTAWGPNGQLLPIFFEKRKSDICFDKNEDIFCATYGNNVTLCPNYGGIYVTRHMSKWCLQGVFYGDPSYRGLCFNKNVLFTSLRNYQDWIDDYIVINANVL